jgi:hypothetical protein
MPKLQAAGWGKPFHLRCMAWARAFGEHASSNQIPVLMNPEKKARRHVDAMFAAFGWVVQAKDNINPSVSRGIAVCKLSFATGELNAMANPIPSFAEQTLIVTETERQLSVVEVLEVVVSANLQRATRLNQLIVQQAFAGKLTRD